MTLKPKLFFEIISSEFVFSNTDIFLIFLISVYFHCSKKKKKIYIYLL